MLFGVFRVTGGSRITTFDVVSPNYGTFTGTRVMVSLPKMSITFTAMMYRPDC